MRVQVADFGAYFTLFGRFYLASDRRFLGYEIISIVTARG